MNQKTLHIAIATTGLTGILNASIALALRLQKEGHRITYMCPQDVRKTVVTHGLDYVQLPSVNFYFKLEEEGLKKRFWYGLKNYEKGKKVLKIGQFKGALTDIKADKLLIDTELHELIFCAIQLKIPVTPITQFFPNLIRPKVPPISSTSLPGKGLWGTRIGILLSWLHSKYYTRKRILIDILKKRDGRRQTLNRYAAEVGIKGGWLEQTYFPPVFEYKGLNVLTLNLEQLDFPNSSLPNFYYTGPMVNEDRNNIHPSESIDAINKILAQKKDKKLIYCSVSSMHEADIAFLKKVVKAFEASPQWLLVLSLGGKSEASDFENIPKNVHLFKWVPQIKVLKNADVSLCHGGVHTINECIHFSVPMLIYSGGKFDQNGCTARVVYHGLGIAGNKKRDSPTKIKNKIAELIQNKRYANSMEQMRESYLTSRKKAITPIV
ncbi:MAG: nucleotide disphospho-sugar-binding domain-containing protein [Bacteroidota bacterium]